MGRETRKRIVQALLIPLLIIGAISAYYYWPKIKPQFFKEPEEEEAIKYYYTVTPLINKDYFDTVHKALGQAKKSIKILMLVVDKGTLPSHPVNRLLQDLIDAHKRGVKVEIILDRQRKAKSNLNVVNSLKLVGIAARLGSSKFSIHDKLILIDDDIAIVGAHNWSYSALMFNNETSVLVKSNPPNPKFLDYFNEIKQELGPEITDEGIREMQKRLTGKQK